MNGFLGFAVGAHPRPTVGRTNREPDAGPRPSAQAGFTLLEVLVALAILGIAVVTLIELASQSLRLVKRSGDYQQAVQLADRVVRDTVVSETTIDTGQEGTFAWERRVTMIALPEELNAPKPAQGAQPTASAELPQLFTVEVAVRWGSNQTLQLATLMTSAVNDPTGAPTGGLQPAGGIQPSGGSQAGAPPAAGPGQAAGQDRTRKREQTGGPGQLAPNRTQGRGKSTKGGGGGGG